MNHLQPTRVGTPPAKPDPLKPVTLLFDLADTTKKEGQQVVRTKQKAGELLAHFGEEAARRELSFRVKQLLSQVRPGESLGLPKVVSFSVVFEIGG